MDVQLVMRGRLCRNYRCHMLSCEGKGVCTYRT